MDKKSLLLLLLIASAGSAGGQTLRVLMYVDDMTPAWEDATTGGSPPATITGTNVSIDSLPTDVTTFRAYYEGGLADIGTVSYNVDENVAFVITSDSIVIIGDPLSDGAINWGGLAGTHPERVLVQASITGNLTGPVTARRIARLDVNGNISGDLLIDDTIATVNPRIGLIHAGGSISGDIETQAGDIEDIIAGASITSSNIIAAGDIDTIDATGSISGDLIEAGGTITRIEADGSIDTVDIFSVGNLGDVAAGTSIGCETIESDGTIDLVYAGDGDIGTSTTTTLIQSNKINTTPSFNIGIVTGDNIFADIIASSTATAKGNVRRVIAADDVTQGGAVPGTATSVITQARSWRMTVNFESRLLRFPHSMSVC